MKRRITALLLALAMALPLTGCSLLERSYSSVERYSSSYYESEDRDVLQPETYQELVNALLAGPTQGGLVSPFPQGLSLQSWELEDGLLTLNFSEQYGGLADISLTLADYCLVLTLSQVEGVDTVQIQSAGHTYHSRSHQTMKADEVLTDQSLPEEVLQSSGEEN